MASTAWLLRLVVPVACLLALPLRAQDADVPRVRTLPGAGSPAFPYAQPEEVGLDSQALQQLADSAAHRVAAGELVGAEILIIKGGRTVFHEAVGWSDRERGVPLQRNAIYRIRSMTKPVIGTAVLMLVDEGRLSLDDAVAAYLPSFDNDRSRSITVRELLTYTSGLRDYGFFDMGLPKEPDEYESLRALVDDVGEIGPLEPRGAFRYGGGSGVPAALVAEISGMPVERFIEARILDPLGMKDTHTLFTPDVPWADRMNSTYRWKGAAQGFERYWDNTMAQRYRFFRGAGGLYSTVSDYARFVQMWMDKGRYGATRLLTEEAVEAALRPLAGGQYGMHWQVPRTPIVDGMPMMFGHGGSDNTLALALPALDAIVLYFTQSRGPVVRERFWYQLSRLPVFERHLASRWHGMLLGDEGLPVEPLHEDEARRYAGTYVGSITVRGEERMHGQWTYEVRTAGQGLRANLARRGSDLNATLPPWHDLNPRPDGVFTPARTVAGRLVEVFPEVQIRFDPGAAGAPDRVEIQAQGDAGAMVWKLERQ